MVKGIILDVDGVIVGEKIGFNTPYPNEKVIERLKEIRQKGIFISLCTAKPHRSVEKIIDDAGLNNLHISNGGGVIMDPIDKIMLKKHVIETKAAQKVLARALEYGAYTEFYTAEDYFVQKDQVNKLTETHSFVLQYQPKIVDNLLEAARSEEIVKLMPVAKDEEDKKRLLEWLKPVLGDLPIGWGIHPIALPHQFAIITAKGISKKQAADEIAQKYGVKHEEMLGVGDSTSDWQFMEMCGYVGAMGNASEELKKLVSSKPEGHFFVGKSVNENGILDILDYFIPRSLK